MCKDNLWRRHSFSLFMVCEAVHGRRKEVNFGFTRKEFLDSSRFHHKSTMGQVVRMFTRTCVGLHTYHYVKHVECISVWMRYWDYVLFLWIASWKPLATWTPDHTLWRKSTLRTPRCTVEICRKTCVFFASLFVATKTFWTVHNSIWWKFCPNFQMFWQIKKFNLFVVAINFVFPLLMRYHSKWFCACVVDDCARFMPPVLDAVTMISEILRCEECKWAGGHITLINCHEKLQMTVNSRLVCSSLDNIEFKVFEQFAVETKDAVDVSHCWWHNHKRHGP